MERYHATSASLPVQGGQDAGCCRPASGSKAERLSFPLCPGQRTYLPILELFPPPALGERRNRGLARRLVAVGRDPGRLKAFEGQLLAEAASQQLPFDNSTNPFFDRRARQTIAAE